MKTPMRSEMENVLVHGQPASPGIAIGPLFILENSEIKPEKRAAKDKEEEKKRLRAAIESACVQLEALKEKTIETVGIEAAAIFDAHALIARDNELARQVFRNIDEENLNAEFAWAQGCAHFAQKLEAMDDEYFRERAADVHDVEQRVLRILAGVAESGNAPSAPAIIAAVNLTPSETIQMDKKLILGICTVEGGPTSHAVILAKALGIPAIIGIAKQVLGQDQYTMAIIDGDKGELVLNPDDDRLERSRTQQLAVVSIQNKQRAAAQEPAVTADGRRVEVVANIGSHEEAKVALENGAEGIGLLRTEFIYLERDSEPSEEEQFEIYKSILGTMGNKPVVVRTLDIGGDKFPAYFPLEAEANPFLGWRAIRMCLDRPELFKTQLRALIRANTGSNLRIMFPMISVLDELRRAKKLVQEVEEQLRAESVAIGDFQVGMMVETPSVAVLADQFTREVDFFSIGTNDLTQYTFAADRTNSRVAHLSDPCHPAILRQIQKVIKAAHNESIWVGLCGELAGDPDAIPILLGLGLDEFSMSSSAIPHAKSVLRNWSTATAEKMVDEALSLESASEVRSFVKRHSPPQ